MRIVGDLVEFGKLGIGTSKCLLVDIKAALAAIDTTETRETWPAGTTYGGKSTATGTATDAWK